MSRKQQEISVSQLGNVAYASAPGLTLLKIGDQPIVATGDFTSYLGKIARQYREFPRRRTYSNLDTIAFGDAEFARFENTTRWFSESAPISVTAWAKLNESAHLVSRTTRDGRTVFFEPGSPEIRAIDDEERLCKPDTRVRLTKEPPEGWRWGMAGFPAAGPLVGACGTVLRSATDATGNLILAVEFDRSLTVWVGSDCLAEIAA